MHPKSLSTPFLVPSKIICVFKVNSIFLPGSFATSTSIPIMCPPPRSFKSKDFRFSETLSSYCFQIHNHLPSQLWLLRFRCNMLNQVKPISYIEQVRIVTFLEAPGVAIARMTPFTG